MRQTAQTIPVGIVSSSVEETTDAGRGSAVARLILEPQFAGALLELKSSSPASMSTI